MSLATLGDILAIFGLPGGWEWIIILIVALLIFGKNLPKVARGAGKSLNEFKKGLKETTQDLEDEVKDISEDVTEDKDEEKQD